MQQIYHQDELDRLLDQYLAGKLSAEEVRRLHAKLQNGEPDYMADEDLDHITLPQDILNPTTKAEKMAEKVRYATTGSNFEWTETRYQKYNIAKSKYVLATALFFVLALIIPFTHLLLSVGHEQSLVEKFFTPHDMLPLQRNIENPNVSKLWYAAILKYRSGNYASAAASLNQLSALQLPDAHIDHFYMGICYIANAQPREAVQHLETAASAPTAAAEDMQNLIQWYLALAYIQNGNPQVAKPLLQHLSETLPFIYHLRAAKLLAAL